MRSFSHVVIGAGAIGSAAAYWLAERGADRVLVLEQHELVNALGSSGDHSRVIRHSYHRPEYTRLTRAMFDAWRHVEDLTGMTAYLRTGGLDLARAETPGQVEVDQYRSAMDVAGISYEDLTAEQVREAYPQWRITDDTLGLYQEAGGLIDIRRAVSMHTSLALSRGVEFRAGTRAERVELRRDGVRVHTASGPLDADHLVVAAASWLEELMPDLGLDFRLTLSQEQVTYIAAPDLTAFAPDRFPVWIHHGEETFYGFPVYGEAAVKLARDMRGRFIRSAERVHVGDEVEGEVLRGFLREHLPAAVGPSLAHRTCVYDMPPDREFVLDVLPHHPHIAVFNGAGHAGKFAGLVGQVLADLTTAGSTVNDISLFSLSRPAITDPCFEPVFRLAGVG